MGAWGYGSFENDTSLDFVSDLINWKKVKKLVNKKKIDSYDYDEIRVTAEILLHLHKINRLWAHQDIIDGLIKGLQQAIEDREWHSSWVEEKGAKAIVRQLKVFVKKLKQIDSYGY